MLRLMMALVLALTLTGVVRADEPEDLKPAMEQVMAPSTPVTPPVVPVPPTSGAQVPGSHVGIPTVAPVGVAPHNPALCEACRYYHTVVPATVLPQHNPLTCPECRFYHRQAEMMRSPQVEANRRDPRPRQDDRPYYGPYISWWQDRSKPTAYTPADVEAGRRQEYQERYGRAPYVGVNRPVKRDAPTTYTPADLEARRRQQAQERRY